ncbi:tail fiber assembly protein [Cronobacter sakazakii]|uniref:tail fiber assembly protein n=1 Tax=Cronobacter sakazakii TaxID=28141 RepID=UPI0009B2132B|nr:tail fiber assembly protein [Cronobacter sakazakii]MDQ1934153.1 tail fiber assembly protein [Cronobacter sakazakii]MDQ1936603.1 tail fiber assembly protein [Cronobacter sakazakii]MDQ1942499.1 tail fiber assembly protein [Cronobacter sakazakii]MDQ1946775.1 tail fiber assembly protein [Cronobacter sakazakii]MDQ1949284.1 tail fiber assembly protein [Cronobacter sakazakii]
MTTKYSFSPSQSLFYANALKESVYDPAGIWPEDAVEVSDSIMMEFTSQPPAGKKLGTDENGNPAWVDVPSQPNSELLKSALSYLSTEYQGDIEILTRAWLAAAVNDGVNETTKKDAVLVQINARKAKYATDRAAVIAQYPV